MGGAAQIMCGTGHTRGMYIPDHIQEVERALLRASAILDAGLSARALERAVAAGEYVRVAHGWYADGVAWRSWFPEWRHLAAVLAAHHNAATPPLFSHYSAAALLGLPLWGFRPGRVHVVSGRGGKSNAAVLRHDLEIPAHHTGSVAGYFCTNHERTVFDIARIADTETALGCADAVLARKARRGRIVDSNASQNWEHEMAELLGAMPRHLRGLDRVRRIVELADPRAESVLESVSRLQLLRLGFELDLQVPVASSSGSDLYMDFELLGLRVYGESDGDFKYTNPALRGGRSADEMVVREKKRDNWVSGSTNHRMVHWGTREAGTPERLRRLLQSYHVPMPRLR